jgi:hypothetical protein
MVLGNKFITSVDNYLIDQLDYNYYLMKDNSGDFNPRDVQYSISFLNNMADITAKNHQTALNSKLKAQIIDYEGKFGAVLQRQQ